jgi:hypothetical protein
MSATAKIRSGQGIANGHWEPTERPAFTRRAFDGGGLRRFLQRLVRPGGEARPSGDSRNRKH